MKTALCKLVMDESSEVIIIITITAATHLDKLEGSVLDLLVRVIEMEVEEVKDLSLVHLTPADLVVLQLVSKRIRLMIFCFLIIIRIRSRPGGCMSCIYWLLFVCGSLSPASPVTIFPRGQHCSVIT